MEVDIFDLVKPQRTILIQINQQMNSPFRNLSKSFLSPIVSYQRRSDLWSLSSCTMLQYHLRYSCLEHIFRGFLHQEQWCQLYNSTKTHQRRLKSELVQIFLYLVTIAEDKNLSNIFAVNINVFNTFWCNIFALHTIKTETSMRRLRGSALQTYLS